MQSLYQQRIMDHYHFPRHKGELEGTECYRSTQAHPSCGDQITFSICIDNLSIKDVRFTGVGCILSLATADMLAERILHKEIEEIADITGEDIKKMVGIEVGLQRIKCIGLPLQSVQQAIKQVIPQREGL